MRQTYIDQHLVQYYKAQIETGNATAAKRAMQHLCQHYRKGLRINPALLDGLEISIVGLLITRGEGDPKIRRWALNCIAQFGREKSCREAVVFALQKYGDDPETAAAAVAALYHISRDANDFLRKQNLIGNDIVVLAALQRVDPKKIEISSPDIHVDRAEPEILKLGLVVVGMNKAPSNLFHPRHTNSEIVKALGGHHDQHVSQYSVWAITENATLGLPDLGVELQDIEAQPVNVRSWMYQLIGMEANGSGTELEYVELGTCDPESEARRGLTVGLKETYFDGLDTLVTDWFQRETDDEVRYGLIDHIVRQSNKSNGYHQMALELYGYEQPNSKLCERMEAVASGTELFGKFKQISFQRQPDLFNLFRAEGSTVNYNINGNVSGNVSIGGKAENSGNINANSYYDQRKFEQIQQQLNNAQSELLNMDVDASLKEEINRQIMKAQGDPNPENLGLVLSGLEKANKAVSSVAGIVESGSKLLPVIVSLGKLIGISD